MIGSNTIHESVMMNLWRKHLHLANAAGEWCSGIGVGRGDKFTVDAHLCIPKTLAWQSHLNSENYRLPCLLRDVSWSCCPAGASARSYKLTMLPPGMPCRSYKASYAYGKVLWEVPESNCILSGEVLSYTTWCPHEQIGHFTLPHIDGPSRWTF